MRQIKIEVPVRGLGRLLLFGLYGAGGAVAGALCGLVVGGAAARAFPEPMQFYHFAVVLAFIGAGIAVGMIVAHAVTLERMIPAPSTILAAATWGAASGFAGFVIAEELAPGSHAAAFAAVAWGVMGGFLGWTIAILFDRCRLIPAIGGGLTAGAAVGWLFFDPAAPLIEIVTQAAALGFVISTMIMLADVRFISFATKGRLVVGANFRRGN
jgi:hypothetical protein